MAQILILEFGESNTRAMLKRIPDDDLPDGPPTSTDKMGAGKE